MAALSGLNADIAAAQQRLERYEAQRQRLSGYLDPIEYEIDTPAPSSSVDYLYNDNRRLLEWYLNHLGVVGVWHALQIIAEQERDKEAAGERVVSGTVDGSWNMLLTDLNKGTNSRCLYYLLTIPRQVLMAVIRGDLPSKLELDTNFRRDFLSRLELTSRPGVYVIYVGRSSKPSGSGKHERGMGLTPAEAQLVWEHLDCYDQGTASDQGSNETCRKIDNAYPGSHFVNYKKGDRRWKWENVGFLKHALEHECLMPNHSHPDRMRLCQAYVGLSGNVLSRAPQHATPGTNSSPVFSVWLSILQKQWPDMFMAFPYQLLRVEHNQELGLCEVLVSVLAGAYCWEGGLSNIHAGRQVGQKGAASTSAYKTNTNLNTNVCYPTENAVHSRDMHNRAAHAEPTASDAKARIEECKRTIWEMISDVDTAIRNIKGEINTLKMRKINIMNDALRHSTGSSSQEL